MSLESILAKYPRPPPRPPPAPAAQPALRENTQAERHRQLAIHHANLIQQRKDIESQNLAALEELIDFPQTTANAATPSRHDAAEFRRLICNFQRSDYDELVYERHAAGKCGYVFCPNPWKTNCAKPGELKLMWDMSRRQVWHESRERVDVWCSMDCKRMAMHIKVQLSEVPAWEKAGTDADNITIIGTSDAHEAWQEMDKAMNELSMQQELADERGEKPNSARMDLVMQPAIREHDSGSPTAPRSTNADSMNIEGYTPLLHQLQDMSLGSKLKGSTEAEGENG